MFFISRAEVEDVEGASPMFKGAQNLNKLNNSNNEEEDEEGEDHD